MYIGHTEEVSTLAVQHSGVMVASASPAFASSPCEIRIWKTSSGKCSKVRSHIIIFTIVNVMYIFFFNIGAHLSQSLCWLHGFL